MEIGKAKPLRKLSVLDLFARAGDWHTQQYAGLIGRLELWEIAPEYEVQLRRRYPKASIRIVDSYKRLATGEPSVFDIIFSDNPASKHGVHFEHFDIFPSVFNWLADHGFIVLSLILNTDERFRQVFFGFGKEDAEARRRFYKTEAEEHLDLQHAISIYREHCESSGFSLKRTYYRQDGFITYLLLDVERCPP